MVHWSDSFCSFGLMVEKMKENFFWHLSHFWWPASQTTSNLNINWNILNKEKRQNRLFLYATGKSDWGLLFPQKQASFVARINFTKTLPAMTCFYDTMLVTAIELCLTQLENAEFQKVTDVLDIVEEHI